MKSKLIGWTIRSSLIVLILVGLWVTTVPALVRAATAPGQQVHSLARLELPQGDLALVVLRWAGKDTTRV